MLASILSHNTVVDESTGKPVGSTLSPASVAISEGETAIHRSALLQSGEPLVATFDPSITTLAASWAHTVRRAGSNPCIGTREFLKDGTRGAYRWKTYREINERVRNFASGLCNLGYSGGERIGVYSINNEDWVVCEQACYQQSFVVVSIYDTLGADVVKFTINHADIHVVVCEKRKYAGVLSVAEHCPGLKYIVLMGDVTEEQRSEAQAKNIKLLSMAELEARGRDNPVEPHLPQPPDLCTIMYTSGTTGDPKGVMLSHANLIATVAGVLRQGLDRIGSSDSYLSFLPLAHIMERVILAFLWSRGARVGFYQGDIAKLVDDAQAVQPTLFCGAPRVYNRIYDKVMNGVKAASAVKRWLFHTAFTAKLAALRAGRRTPVWDRLVFDAVRNAILGPNVRILVSGSAPLSAAVQDFLRVVFSCDVLQGYGLTETAAAVTLACPGDLGTLHVGPPIVCSEIKLVDVPEMNYLASDRPQRGEVCIRGHNVFLGYYRNEEETRKVLSRDGWLRTGDVGRWNPDGTLSIIDRVKNIFKLSQGEYIAAEKLENVIVQSPLVAQAWVYGNSEQSCVVCVCVPDPEQLGKWAAETLGMTGDVRDPAFVAALCRDPRARQAVLADIARLGKENQFTGLEYPKAVYLEPAPWTVDSGLMTPTFKLKRPQMAQRYRPIADQMYAELAAAAAAAGK